MKRLKGLLILGLLLAGAGRAFAGNGGGDPFDFLFIDAGARSVGMGGAYTALANDANALQYNPGGLGMEKSYEATFMHNVHIEGVSQDYVAVAAPFDAGGMHHGVSVNFNYLKFADTTRTTYASPNGTGASFGINDLAVAAGYGLTVVENVSLGASLKYLRESIDNGSINGTVFDVGGLFTVPALPRLSLGLAVQNIGPDQKFQKVSNNPGREHMPVNIRGGAAYGFALPDWNMDNTLAVDVAKERNSDTVVGVGVESIVMKMLAIRFGYNSRNSVGAGVSVGVGWVAPSFNIDYAIVPMGDLGYSNRISVSYRWGQANGKMAAAPKSINGLQTLMPTSVVAK